MKKCDIKHRLTDLEMSRIPIDTLIRPAIHRKCTLKHVKLAAIQLHMKKSDIKYRLTDLKMSPKTILISPPKHMLWVLKRTV